MKLRSYRWRTRIYTSIVIAFSVVAISVSYYYIDFRWVLYRYGENSYKKHQYDHAVHYYLLALKNDLPLNQVSEHLAKAYLQSKEDWDTHQEVERRIKTDPDSYNTLFGAGNFYITLGDFKTGIVFFNKILEKYPYKVDVLQDIASSYRWNREYLSAIKIYKEMIMIHKKPTINLLLKIAESYLLNENYDQAMEYLNQALAIDPDDLATRKQIALTYRSSGQITLAIAYLKDLIQETDGKDKELLLELARAYLGIKHYEDAIKIVMNCIDEDPDNIAAHLLLADIEMAKGHLIDAKSTWQLVLAKHPYDFSLRLTYADTAQKWGDYYESERIYRKYLNKAPWSATYSYSLAGILNSMNRRIEAEAIYKKLLRSANNIKRACTELADLHETIKDFPKAIYWAEMALIEDPTNSYARMLLAKIYVQKKQYELAKKQLIQLPKIFYLSADNQLELAKLYLAMDQTDEVFKHLKMARLMEPGSVSLSFFHDLLIMDPVQVIESRNHHQLSSLELQQLASWLNLFKKRKLALEVAQRAVEKDRYNLSAVYQLSFLQMDDDYPLLAIQNMSELTYLMPNNYLYLLWTARFASWDQEYEKAFYYYNLMRKQDPNDYAVLLEDARVRYWAKEPFVAFSMYQEELKIPVDHLLKESIHNMDLEHEDYLLDNTLHQHSNLPYALYEKIYQAEEKGRYYFSATGDKELNSILAELYSTYLIQKLFFLESKAMLENWAMEYFKARDTYEELVSVFPSAENALSNLAQVNCELNLYNESMKNLDNLAEQNRDNEKYQIGSERAHILSHPYFDFSYYYWSEAGREFLDRINRKRFNFELGFPIKSQFTPYATSLIWKEMPTFSGAISSWAYGYEVGGKGKIADRVSLEGFWQQKFYEQPIYPDANVWRAYLWYDVSGRTKVGLLYDRENKLDNYFALLQKVQFDRAWAAFRSIVKRRLSIEVNGRWMRFNEHNSMQYHDLIVKMIAFPSPYELTGYIRSEIRDTRHQSENVFVNGILQTIIHPYWTPHKYIAARGGVVWKQDFRKKQFCRDLQHYYMVDISSGTDSEKNPLLRMEAKYLIEFYKRMSFSISGMRHQSRLWNAHELLIDYRINF